MAIRPITDTLRQLRHGVFLDEASEALANVVKGVQETGKAGKLTIEINVKKATRGGAMILLDKIKATVPQDAPAETMLFATPEGNLQADDPNQRKLDLKAVPDAPVVELKTADGYGAPTPVPVN